MGDGAYRLNLANKFQKEQRIWKNGTAEKSPSRLDLLELIQIESK
jgi:hypothetical protein